MPTASDELRAKMYVYFGEEIDDGPPTRFLEAAGYTERAGIWSKPAPQHVITEKEFYCLLFLRDEWDYDFADWEKNS